MANNINNIIDTLKKYDGPVICDAVERLEVRDPIEGFASAELKCQFPEQEPMVGYAVTCVMDSNHPNDKRPLGWETLLENIHAAKKPVVIVIQDIGSDHSRSNATGSMGTTAYQKVGAVGLVTNCGFRDRNDIEKRSPGFQMFTTGEVISHGHNAFVDFNVTVEVCGLTINPGDLMFGDRNGLITIPPKLAEPTIEQAEDILKAEAGFFDFLNSKEFSYEMLKKRIAIYPRTEEE